VGKVFSPMVLGYYLKAETLKTQVQTYTTNSLGRVLFPMFSQLQDDEEKFKQIYFKVSNVVAGLIVFLVAPLYFLAQYIIILLLGDQWQPTVILFQILVLSALTSPQINIMGRAILAKGYSKLKFTTGLLQRFFKFLPIGIGLYYGIEEFAIAMVISSFLVFFLFTVVLQYKLQLEAWKQIKSFLLPNVIFFSLVFIQIMFNEVYNQWVFVFVFLIANTIFLFFIKHQCIQFLIDSCKKYFESKLR
jgi:O-antigen/teichoic acid export membrane protein